jgi:hypothetical protein
VAAVLEMLSARRSVALLACLVALAACEARKPDITGVGPWSVVKTKRKDASGVCQPTELPDGRAGTWCFGQKPFGLAKRAAAVDLYFLGTESEAPLIELQLTIRGCVEDDVEAWLREHFGAPVERRDARAYWRTSRLFLAAFLPQDPGRCVLRMLPLGEGAEIERLKLL